MRSTAEDGLSHNAFPAKQGTFWQGSRKVINKRSDSNVIRTFVQIYLVFNNALKMFAPKGDLYVV